MSASRMRSHAGAAFTLVEMIVALAVVLLLAVCISQILGSASRTVSAHENRMEVEEQVRTVFGTMDNDFAHLLKRTDAESIMSKQPGNDYMFFYSETPGYFDNTNTPYYERSPLSLVGYRINSSYQLERFAKGLTWDDGTNGLMTGPVFLTYPSPVTPPVASSTPYPNSLIETKWSTEIPPPADTSTDPNYQVISQEIFRLEICFLLNNGVISDQPYLTDSTHVNGLQDVRAVIVTVAVINDASRKIVPTATMSSLASSNLFADSGFAPPPAATPGTTPPSLPATVWNNKLNSGSFATTASIPPQAASQVRVYQHYIYLNKN